MLDIRVLGLAATVRVMEIGKGDFVAGVTV
jgi:hypothetical protein